MTCSVPVPRSWQRSGLGTSGSVLRAARGKPEAAERPCAAIRIGVATVYCLVVDDAGLQGEISRLYALPLGEFTRERDAVARRLRSEGRRDEAKEIADLRKPVLAAWVVNRLTRERRAEVEALVEAARAIRAGKAEDERFRATADSLVRAGREVLLAEGRRPTDAVLRDVATTVRSAAAAEPALLLGGRLTEPVEELGFEAMAGAVPRPPASPGARRQPKQAPQPDRAVVQEARTALAAARDEARRLARAADVAERDARSVRADADAAERSVVEAEAALARLTP